MSNQGVSLVKLISIVDDPDSEPPSRQYNFYSDQVTMAMSRLRSELEARQFVMDTYILSLAASVSPVVVFYAPLREYVKRFRKTPELLVTLYSYASAVPPEEQAASEWLIQADRIDPENEYVLWQRLLSRGDPWFPHQLVHSNNLLEEERWLLDKLLKNNPNDLLLIGVESYLQKEHKPLFASDNIDLINSLRRLVPHPMKQLGLLDMMNPRKIHPRSRA